MSDFNKVIELGRLTKEVELTYTSGGQAKARFSIAVNRRWKNKEGEKQEETSFIPVTAWGRQAEAIAQFFKKGDPILVEGRLRTFSYEKDGAKVYSFEVVMEKFEFMSKSDSGSGESVNPDDIPF